MNKYTIIRTIGNGSVGSVFLAKEKKSNRIYAIKKISIKKCEYGCHMQEAAHNEVLFILKYFISFIFFNQFNILILFHVLIILLKIKTYSWFWNMFL